MWRLLDAALETNDSDHRDAARSSDEAPGAGSVVNLEHIIATYAQQQVDQVIRRDRLARLTSDGGAAAARALARVETVLEDVVRAATFRSGGSSSSDALSRALRDEHRMRMRESRTRAPKRARHQQQQHRRRSALGDDHDDDDIDDDDESEDAGQGTDDSSSDGSPQGVAGNGHASIRSVTAGPITSPPQLPERHTSIGASNVVRNTFHPAVTGARLDKG